MNCNCMNVPTPGSILTDTEIDVFEEALSGYADRSWYADLKAKLWARYRIRMINSCSVDLWQQMLTDALADALLDLADYLDAYYSLDAKDKMDFITDAGKTTSTYENEDLPDIPVEEGKEYLSTRGRTITETEGARSELYSLKFAYEERMDLLGKVADRISGVFLNRWA